MTPPEPHPAPPGLISADQRSAGLEIDAADRRVIDRATRDRLVIFDPSSAPLIRPLILAADLRPWSVAAADRWLITLPATLAGPQLAQRHPALARQLEPMGAGALEPSPAPAPRLLITPGPSPVVAWDSSAALAAAPIGLISRAAPLWLALLGSREGRRRLADGADPAQIVGALLPADLPGPAREHLAGLGLSLAALSRERHRIEALLLKQLLADFAPPGAVPGARLGRWWELEFAELRAELAQTMRGDIPERYRPAWAERHHEQRRLHQGASAQIAAAEAALDRQVEGLS